MTDVFDLKAIVDAAREVAIPTHDGDYFALMHPEQRRTWLCAAVREQWRLNHRLERTLRRGAPQHHIRDLERLITELDAEIRWLRGLPYVEG